MQGILDEGQGSNYSEEGTFISTTPTPTLLPVIIPRGFNILFCGSDAFLFWLDTLSSEPFDNLRDNGLDAILLDWNTRRCTQ